MNSDYPKVYLYLRLVQAKLFIDAHYATALDLDNIADEACFSKFHFIRLFKQVYGKTPHQYLTAVRIAEARRLLMNELAVTEVCEAVGFESVSSFSGLFKKVVGLTPTSFSQNYQLRQKEMEQNPLRFIPGCIATKSGWLKNSNFQEAE